MLLANGLAARGHQVTLLLLQQEGVLRPLVAPEVTVRLHPWWHPPTVDPEVTDSVLISGTTNTETGAATLWRARPSRSRGRRRWLVAAHDPPRQDGRTYTPALARFMQRSDGYVALSTGHWQALQRHQPLHPTVHVVANGTELSFPEPPDAPVPGDPLQLVFLGRMTEQKGVDILLEALTGLTSARWTLDLYGDGPDRARLEEVYLGRFDGRVRYRGVTPDTAGVLRAADVLVMPSRNEAMPMVVIEAMAAGTVVVASAVGAVADMLGSGACGTLVDMPTSADTSRPDDGQVRAWRDALAELFRDPTPALVRRTAAWRRQREHYSVPAMLDGYERAIAAVLGSRP